MKTFNDLTFVQFPHIRDLTYSILILTGLRDCKHAALMFDNEFGVSVAFGGCFYLRTNCEIDKRGM